MTSKLRFLRHYGEMVAAMLIGMVVLMFPAGVLFRVFGTSWSELTTAPKLIAMAVTMAVPMAAWMRYRGHAWRLNAEMTGSMLLPTVVLTTLIWTGAVNGGGALMGVEHVAMLATMLVAMLLRRDEYACPHGHVDAVAA